ncbi:hypothetical protein OF83DRAFT_1121432 [Amylostereum chailletii]|nr:hypothetical protein OF83DRAFT_1121432 [Amylostereum chailletii]
MPLVGGNLYALEADVVDHKALKAAAAEVSKITGGTLDVLINNAAKTTGRHYFTALTDLERREDELEEEALETYRVNVVGVMHTTNVFLPLLRAGPTKKIISISSAAADTEFIFKTNSKHMVVYAASKAALNMVVAKYANQLREDGFINVAVSPGIVNTEETTIGSHEPPPGFQQALDSIKRGYPDWTPVALTPKQSVESCLGTISRLEVKDNGAFVSEKGGTVLFED